MKDFFQKLWNILKPALLTVFTLGINWLVKWVKKYLETKEAYLDYQMDSMKNEELPYLTKREFKFAKKHKLVG